MNHQKRSKGFQSYLVTPSLILLFSILSSCNSNLSSDQYTRWITNEENGLRCKKNSGVFIFDLQYKPWEFVWLEQQNNVSREQAKQELDGLQYYTLTISVEAQGTDIINYGVQSQEDIQHNLYYYSYLFQNDVYLLEENGNKLPCVLYHFERSGNLKSVRTFELGFEKRGLSKEARLIIQSDKFSTLPVQIIIKKENIPTLI